MLYIASLSIVGAGVMSAAASWKLIGHRTGDKEALTKRCCNGESKRCHVPFAGRLLHALSCIITGVAVGIIVAQKISTDRVSSDQRQDALQDFEAEHDAPFMAKVLIGCAVAYLGLIVFSFFNMKEDMDEMQGNNDNMPMAKLLLIGAMLACGVSIAICGFQLKKEA